MARPKPFDDLSESEDHDQQVLAPEESRQGVISGRVVTILTTSLVLALIAFAIVYSMNVL